MVTTENIFNDKMLSMANNFPEWLLNELDSRGWSQADLSRAAGITRGTISLILSGERGPGNDVCLAIAEALKVPPEYVFRKAGLLPDKPKINEKTEKALHLFAQLGETDQDEVIEYLEMKIRRAELNREANDVAARLEDLPPAAVEEFVKILDDYLSKHGYQRTR